MNASHTTPEAAGEPAVETHGLTRHWGDIQAVDGLDLAVRQGEMFGLVGPDGAGKSTTIRMLCGLLKPTRGEARVLGCDLVGDAGRLKRQIGYLSQQFTLYGDLTVEENLGFFASIHHVDRTGERRRLLLQATGLAPFGARLAQHLSGGMKKKLALACALVHTPRLLLLDEPSTGVDPVSRGEFWTLLSERVAEGMTVILTTPYLDEAERCQRVGLLHRGRMLVTGTPGEIRSRVPGRLVNLRGPRPAAAFRRLRERWSAVQVSLYGDRLCLWSPDEAGVSAAVDWLETAGLGPVTPETASPSLEDAFIALTADTAGSGDAP